MSTQEYIQLLYRVENDLDKCKIVHSHRIFRCPDRKLHVDIYLHHHASISDAFYRILQDVKSLARMAVCVQKFAGARVSVRYIDHKPIVSIPDVVI